MISLSTINFISEILRAVYDKDLTEFVCCAEFVYATYLHDNKILNHSILINTENGRIIKSNIFDGSTKLPASLNDLNKFGEIESSQLLESICCICYNLNKTPLLNCRHNVCGSCLIGMIKANLRKACPMCGIKFNDTSASYKLCKDTNVYSNFGLDGFLFEEEAIVIFSFFQKNPLAIFCSNKKQTEFAVKEKTNRCNNIWKIKMNKTILFSIVTKKIFGYVTAEHTSDNQSLRSLDLLVMLPDRCIIQTTKREVRDHVIADNYFQQLINFLTKCNSIIGEKKYDSGQVSTCLKLLETKKNRQDLKSTRLQIQSNKKLIKHAKLSKKLTQIKNINHILKYKNIDIKQLDKKLILLKNKQKQAKNMLNNLLKRSDQLQVYFTNEDCLTNETTIRKGEYESESDLDFGEND